MNMHMDDQKQEPLILTPTTSDARTQTIADRIALGALAKARATATKPEPMDALVSAWLSLDEEARWQFLDAVWLVSHRRLGQVRQSTLDHYGEDLEPAADLVLAVMSGRMEHYLPRRSDPTWEE
jgi:hypothetical protein